MRTASEWLSEYGASHQNPTNKLLHWICVPPIVLAVMGFLWSAPVPAAFTAISPWLNWATLAALAAIVYYLMLSPALAAGVLVAFAVLLAITHGLARLPWPLWATSLVIFVVAWIGQFVGHAIEGKRPSFFKDTSGIPVGSPRGSSMGALQFLLIGPLWLLAAAYRRAGIPY